tara:strand:- start:8659 stop:10647 length:1989 start_codon:yes stop_codon:yes gene_type:complete
MGIFNKMARGFTRGFARGMDEWRQDRRAEQRQLRNLELSEAFSRRAEERRARIEVGQEAFQAGDYEGAEDILVDDTGLFSEDDFGQRVETANKRLVDSSDSTIGFLTSSLDDIKGKKNRYDLAGGTYKEADFKEVDAYGKELRRHKKVLQNSIEYYGDDSDDGMYAQDAVARIDESLEKLKKIKVEQESAGQTAQTTLLLFKQQGDYSGLDDWISTGKGMVDNKFIDANNWTIFKSMHVSKFINDPNITFEEKNRRFLKQKKHLTPSQVDNIQNRLDNDRVIVDRGVTETIINDNIKDPTNTTADFFKYQNQTLELINKDPDNDVLAQRLRTTQNLIVTSSNSITESRMIAFREALNKKMDFLQRARIDSDEVDYKTAQATALPVVSTTKPDTSALGKATTQLKMSIGSVSEQYASMAEEALSMMPEWSDEISRYRLQAQAMNNFQTDAPEALANIASARLFRQLNTGQINLEQFQNELDGFGSYGDYMTVEEISLMKQSINTFKEDYPNQWKEATDNQAPDVLGSTVTYYGVEFSQDKDQAEKNFAQNIINTARTKIRSREYWPEIANELSRHLVLENNTGTISASLAERTLNAVWNWKSGLVPEYERSAFTEEEDSIEVPLMDLTPLNLEEEDDDDENVVGGAIGGSNNTMFGDGGFNLP